MLVVMAPWFLISSEPENRQVSRPWRALAAAYSDNGKSITNTAPFVIIGFGLSSTSKAGRRSRQS
jgi:hypothetical protein